MRSHSIMYLFKDNYFTLKLVGELRFILAPVLERALQILSGSTQIKHVIIDMAEVSYVDSTILGTLISFFLKEENKDKIGCYIPIIICHDEDLQKLLRGIGVDKIFNLKNSYSIGGSSLEEYTAVEEFRESKTVLEQCIHRSHETLSELQPGADHQLVVKSLKNRNDLG